MITLNRQALRVKCSQEPARPSVKPSVTQSIRVLRKKLEDARGPDVRDTWNKVSVIASNDVRFANEVIKELDVFHKNMVDMIRASMPGSTAPTGPIDSTAIVPVDDENIFKAS